MFLPFITCCLYKLTLSDQVQVTGTDSQALWFSVNVFNWFVLAWGPNKMFFWGLNQLLVAPQPVMRLNLDTPGQGNVLAVMMWHKSEIAVSSLEITDLLESNIESTLENLLVIWWVPVGYSTQCLDHRSKCEPFVNKGPAPLSYLDEINT